MIQYDYTRTESGSAVEPVTATEMKNYLRENYGTNATEDTLIGDMITAARRWIEEETRRAFALQTVVYWAFDDEGQIDELSLPFTPIVTLTSVKRKDFEGVETTLTLNEDYYKAGLRDNILTFNKFWSTGAVNLYPLYVTYTAGYATAVAMPKELKMAVYKLVSENYVNRDATVDWSIQMVPYSVAQWIAHLKERDF